MIYGGTTVLSKVISFFMLPIYAHYLNAEGYGMLGMIDVIISVATLLIGYGIAGAMWRFYFEKETEEERKTLVSTTIILMFLLVILASLPLLLFYKQLGALAFGRDDLGHYIVLAALTFICSMTSKTAEAYILIRQKPFIFSALALLQLVLGLSLNIYFIVYLELGVLGFLYTSLIGAVVSTLITHGYALHAVGIRFDKIVAKTTLRFSMPLIPGYIATFLRGNADRVILRSSMGLAVLGAYEMLITFTSLIGILIVEPFSKSWNVKRLEICDKPEGPSTIARMFTLQLVLLFFFGLVLALEIPLLLRIMTPPAFWLEWNVALIMVFARIFNASHQQLAFGLLYAKKTGLISTITIICTAVDIGLNIILIPLYGIPGAVTTSCIAQAFQCGISFLLARKFYVTPFEWGKIIQMSIVTLVLFAGISQISLADTAVSSQLTRELAPIVTDAGEALHLDKIKNGKALSYAVNNIGPVIEAGIKLVLSLLFIPIMVCLNILPRRMLSLQFLRHPFQA